MPNDPLNDDACYRALEAKDARFDGLFFVGVATTGIYCRPVCTAQTPRRERCAFFRTSAAAEREGYRACFVCRPEIAPGRAAVDATDTLTRLACAEIERGCLDEEPVASLAARLGVTPRHLRRTLVATVGASPTQLAQTRRLAIAKALLQDSSLAIADVAMASGFGSIRRFNAAFSARFGRPPTEVRRRLARPGEPGLTLRLDYRPPLDWQSMLSFLAARAIPGVEEVTGESYSRVLCSGIGATGLISVRPDAGGRALRLTLPLTLARQAAAIARRSREVFDLDARPDIIAASMSGEPTLAEVLARHPGLRVPGAYDAFELTVRTVLGQQVSVRGATTLAGRLVRAFGLPLDEPAGGLTHRFPTPGRVAKTPAHEVAALGLPGQRAETIVAVAGAFRARPARADLLGRLASIRGIGPWTTSYVGMRVLKDPDALLETDLGVRKALGGASPGAIRAQAEAWRPWRSYAVMALWQSLSET